MFSGTRSYELPEVTKYRCWFKSGITDKTLEIHED